MDPDNHNFTDFNVLSCDDNAEQFEHVRNFKEWQALQSKLVNINVNAIIIRNT